jgi:hypothetical protein
MEQYFNEVCEAYFLQKNGASVYPSLSELAHLYFNTKDEIKAVAYLLGKEQGGSDCLLDDETIYLHKPTAQYPKPSLKFANFDKEILILNPITLDLPSRERPILASPRVNKVV